MTIRKLVLLFVIQSIVVGCASQRSMPLAVNTSPANPQIVNLLYEQYNGWRGVPHKDGGPSKKGVDCSGFVYLTYRQKLNQNLPRTTALLAKSGSQISTREMTAGDLVFFKTVFKKRHVGIYIDNGQFMHASSSRGVMISQLDNPYWSDAFWMVRRY